ncbi:MAG: PDZ domain-containing protein [Lacibacter sp.]
MKRLSIYVLAFIAAAQFPAINVSAQSEVKEKKDKVEKQEIIIRKKGNKKEKTTIVIEGDKVTVNGKPVEKGNKDIVIEKFDGNEMIMRMPKMPREVYRFNHGMNWNSDGLMKEFHFDFKEGALLGVVTKENEKGVEVAEVQKESAAEKAGLQKGDIITNVGDQKIEKPGDLVKAITEKKPKDEVEITYLRNGKESKVKTQLGESRFPQEFQHKMELKQNELMLKQKEFQRRQQEFQDRQFEFQFKQPFGMEHFDGPMMWKQKGPQLGITIQDTEEGNGVKVLDTDKESPAEKNGVLKDDIITEINGKKVTNVAEAREALHQKTENNAWNLKVLRAGKVVNMEIKIPKKLNKADL